MIDRLARLWARSREIIGISYLSIDFINFTKMHSLFNFAVNLSGVFISTFILRSGGTVALVSLYVLLTHVFEMTAGLLSPSLSNRLRRSVMTALGLCCYLGAYTTLVLARDHMDRMFPLVALFISLGAGFYFGSYHGSLTAYTNARNRQVGMSLLGLTGNFFILATPLLAGVILAGVVGTPGYLIVFSLTLTALLLALWQSRKLPSDPAVRRGYSAWRFLKQYAREPVVRYMLLTIFFFGLREALFAFYLNILVFELAGGSELAVGVTTTLKGVGAMLMFLFIGKLLTPKMRTDGPLYIYLLMLAVCSALLLFTNMWMVAAVSVLDAVCMGFIGNSTQFSSYEVMDHFQRRCPEHDLRLEMVPVRNAALSFGRVAGMALFFLLPFPSGSVLPLVIFTAAALPCALFIKLTETGLKRAGYRA